MPYYSKDEYTHKGFRKSKTRGKMYDAIIVSKKDKDKIIYVPFGASDYENYKDTTGLNLYNDLIHGDEERRRNYIRRHKGFIKSGYYSPGQMSMDYLW